MVFNFSWVLSDKVFGKYVDNFMNRLWVGPAPRLAMSDDARVGDNPYVMVRATNFRMYRINSQIDNFRILVVYTRGKILLFNFDEVELRLN